MAFPINELVDMVLMYGECRQNSASARRRYAEQFPHRQLPARATFVQVVQRLRDTGRIDPQRREGPGRRNRILDAAEDIIEAVENDPTLSTRQLARQFNVSNYTVWRTLHEDLMHPYHYRRVQSLLPADYPARVQFCEWVQQQYLQNAHFVGNILFSDEASFTRNGVFNIHNAHEWHIENPRAIRPAHHQRRFSFNVWIGIINNYIIGPFFLPARLNGQVYLDFLQNHLPGLLEDIPLNIRASMWYQHDGSPVHYVRVVREHLNDVYEDRWIGRGGPVHWPPRSPDLNPVDFFLWGYLKDRVYRTQVNDIDELRERIIMETDHIRQRNLCESVRVSLIRRVGLCIQENGGNFEQLL